MKILVTGGAGYIGSHTCVALYQQGLEIVIVDDFSNSDISVIENIEKIVNQTISYYAIDVKDTSKLEYIFDKHSFDAVIHFAGFKSVYESINIPLNYYSNNIGSTISLLNVCKKYHVKNIIFSSSASVYANNISPMKEDYHLKASNPYAETKIMCEKILNDFVKANPDFKIIILRYFNPIGAHKSGYIGDKAKQRPDNLMPYITKVSAGELDKLVIFGDDYDTIDGTAIRDFIHVMDLAEGHVKALSYKGEGIQIFNLGTGIGISVLQLVHAFTEVNSVRVPYVFSERRAGDLPEVYADNNKALTLLNWKPTRTLEDMCRDSWNFEQKFKVDNNYT